MAKFLSKFVQDNLVAYLFGTAMPTAPTAYVALVTTAPTDTAGTALVELSTSGTGYARVALGAKGTTTTSGSGTTSVEQAANAAALTFGPATATWTIVGVALYDASTGGNLLAYGDLTATQTITSGNSFQLPVGNLPVQA